MAKKGKEKDQRTFIIELKSKGDMKSASLDENEKVYIEGSLGSFKRAQFLEGLVLEVIGSNGELRVDLAMNDLHLRPHKAKGSKEDRGDGR
jgi:hypothetical protein